MKPTIFIAGSGGIGRAAALIILESEHIDASVMIGDASESNLQEAMDWLKAGTAAHKDLESVLMSPDGMTPELEAALTRSAVLLDCLPGALTPRMAQYCADYNAHYANLTEYVAETEAIQNLAKDANTGFILQTGLAPGYIDVLGVQLFDKFCDRYQVDKVSGMRLRVGALSENAISPHFYAFTWSPIGVATEYIKDSVVVRDHSIVHLPSLSEREELLLQGIRYEADFTSGGVADLPAAFGTRIANIDYKTIRFPGHYDWVKDQIARQGADIQKLEDTMLQEIPMVENDRVLVYAEVYGKDNQGNLRSLNITKDIAPTPMGVHTLRAIQSTTAAPLVESARMLLSGKHKGVITQSQIPADDFIHSPIVERVYGGH